MNTICRICNKRNHSTKECPEKCSCGSLCHSKERHFCNICGQRGYTHNRKDCSEKCPCEWTSVYIHNKENHECFICKKKGYKHEDDDCPEKCGCGYDDHTRDEHDEWYENIKRRGQLVELNPDFKEQLY